jgi:cytochrome P450
MAVIQAGFPRATLDIDLLIDASPDNIARVRRALLDLPDQAVRDMGEDDLAKYVVVKVADEIVVDLMARAGGVEYEEASRMVEVTDVEGVAIPFAGPALLLKTKQTVRDRDRIDREYLELLLRETGGA